MKTNKRESKSIQLLNTYIAVVSSHKVSKIVTLYTCAYIHSKSQYYQEGWKLNVWQRQKKTNHQNYSFPKLNDFECLHLDFLRLVIDVLISLLQLWTTHTYEKNLSQLSLCSYWWELNYTISQKIFDFKLP